MFIKSDSFFLQFTQFWLYLLNRKEIITLLYNANEGQVLNWKTLLTLQYFTWLTRLATKVNVLFHTKESYISNTSIAFTRRYQTTLAGAHKSHGPTRPHGQLIKANNISYPGPQTSLMMGINEG